VLAVFIARLQGGVPVKCVSPEALCYALADAYGSLVGGLSPENATQHATSRLPEAPVDDTTANARAEDPDIFTDAVSDDEAAPA
jgi:hypothetical protein